MHLSMNCSVIDILSTFIDIFKFNNIINAYTTLLHAFYIPRFLRINLGYFKKTKNKTKQANKQTNKQICRASLFYKKFMSMTRSIYVL